MGTLSLRVLLFPGDTTLTLDDVPASTTLLQLRTLLIARLPLADGARIPGARIIYGGRQLGADQAHLALPQLGIPSQGVASLHVVMGGSASAGAPPGAPPAAAEDLAAAGAEAGQGGAAGLRGFDRLQHMGLDAEAIAVVRSLFLPEVLSAMGPHLPREAGETEQRRVLRMEETWMSIQGEHSDFAHNIRPFLRRGAGGGASAPAFQLPPRGAAAGAPAWMLHPYVQQTMLHARAAGMSEQDVLRAGYAAAARVGLDPTAGEEGGEGGGGGGGGEGGGMGDARANLGAIAFGVFVGSFLGWIAVFFLLNGSSNRWFKSGVTLGILVNLVMLIMFPPSDSEPAGGSSSSGGGSGSGSGSGSSSGSRAGGSGSWDSPSDSPWARAVGGGPSSLAPSSG